jgi:dual specificity phosphatase 12
LTFKSISFPRSIDLVEQQGITHVLSLVSLKDKPNLDATLGIKHLHCDIEDNPYEDLLMVLDGLCAWIADALACSPERRVLVHCVQGISRSGAVVIAYLMRTRSLTYDSALKITQESRAVILPNSGFADQLRLWEAWNCSIIHDDEAGAWTIKPEYEDWRANRGVLLSRDQDKKQEVIRKHMIQMAIDLEKRQK